MEFTRADRLVAGLAAVIGGVHLLNLLTLRSVALTYALLFGAYGAAILLARHEPSLRPLLVVGTVAGGVALTADYFLVDVVGAVSYPRSYPTVLDSPAYMPVTWALAVVQLGHLARRLDEAYGRRRAVLAVALVTGGFMWFFETTAVDVGLWSYGAVPGPAIRHVPLALLLAEMAAMGALPYALDRAPPVGGAIFGLTITGSYVAVYALALAVVALV